MNEYERREAIIKKLAKFCPIDGAELVSEQRQIGHVRVRLVTVEVKVCPNGHGQMDVGPAEGWAGPHAIFELNEKLFEEETVE